MTNQPAAFGKYQLIKKLATGGMAEVWLAEQGGIEGFRKRVVVKRILPHLAGEAEFVTMFLNEARICARFNHPNIAQIFDFGEIDGSYYIAMEYVRGEDLGRVMRKAYAAGQWVARPLALRIVAACCEGLYYAHTQSDNGRPLNVVHRDISPQNILISFDGSVKLVDFGIAKASDQTSTTRAGAIKGKFSYMSPEQAAGKELDARSDLFSMGLVLYELVTGVRPLKRESELATLQAAMEAAVEPPSAVVEVPQEFDSVIMRALRRDRNDRYQTAREFQIALEELLTQQRMGASSVQISELMTVLFAERLQEEARSGEAARANTPIKDLSWDAPVAAPVPAAPKRRTSPPELPASGPQLPPPLPASPRAPSSSTQPVAPGSDMDWEAPPGDLQPRRRTPEVRPTDAARPATRPTRSLPVSDDDSTSSALTVAFPGPAPRRRTSSVALGQQQPRASSVGIPRASLLEMPEAPPRRRADDDDEDSLSARRPSDVAQAELERGLRRARRRAFSSRLMAFGLLAATLALAWGYRNPLLEAAQQLGSNDGYLVSVSVKPDATVRVIHRPDELMRGSTVLGPTPFFDRKGAHAGDTLIIEQPTLGLFYSVQLPKQPEGTPFVFTHEFRKGRLRLKILPGGAADLEIFYAGGNKVGSVAGAALELYEGHHQLEVQGDRLREPVPFEVEIKPGQTTDKTVEIGRSLIDG